MVMLLAAVVAGPWSLVDLALGSIASRTAESDPAIAAQTIVEAGSPGWPRIRRLPPLIQNWRIEPQAVVAEQDEPDDPAQDATAGWWASPRPDRPSSHFLLAGRTSAADSDGRSSPRAPTRIQLRC